MLLNNYAKLWIFLRKNKDLKEIYFPCRRELIPGGRMNDII